MVNGNLCLANVICVPIVLKCWTRCRSHKSHYSLACCHRPRCCRNVFVVVGILVSLVGMFYEIKKYVNFMWISVGCYWFDWLLDGWIDCLIVTYPWFLPSYKSVWRSFLKAVIFFDFNEAEGVTDWQTNRAAYRGVRAHLKTTGAFPILKFRSSCQ